MLTEKQKTEDWKNAYLKSEQERLETKKLAERNEEEAEDWKKEAFANRKVQAESKKTQAQTSFVEEFQKLQSQKGINTNN